MSNESGIMKNFMIQSATENGSSLNRNLLNSNDIFWVNCASVVYIWIGKKSNKSEKSQVFKYIEDEMRLHCPYSDIPQILVKEGQEPNEFWDIFNGNLSSYSVQSSSKWLL